MTVSPEMCDLIRRTALDLPLGAVRRRYHADTITTLGLGQREAATSVSSLLSRPAFLVTDSSRAWVTT